MIQSINNTNFHFSLYFIGFLFLLIEAYVGRGGPAWPHAFLLTSHRAVAQHVNNILLCHAVDVLLVAVEARPAHVNKLISGFAVLETASYGKLVHFDDVGTELILVQDSVARCVHLLKRVVHLLLELFSGCVASFLRRHP